MEPDTAGAESIMGKREKSERRGAEILRERGQIFLCILMASQHILG